MKSLNLCLFISTFVLLTSVDNYGQGLPVDNVSTSLPCLDKNFNVRVIMTVDSSTRAALMTEQQVDAILAEASYYFSPICVSLSSCSYDVLPNYAYNKLDSLRRVEEMGIVYHYPRRITLFIVNEVYGSECGYSYYDGLNSRNMARIFVELNCTDTPAQQIAHHVGSLLGLLDTNHRPTEELADGSNCATTGDRICDTPADPFGAWRDDEGNWREFANPNLAFYADGCEFIWEEKDDAGNFYNPNTTNMMSPYNCKCSFTREQFLRMVENYNNSNYIKY